MWLRPQVPTTVDPNIIAPLRGQVYHLRGPGRAGKSMRTVAEHWLMDVLADGQPVHWIDGACRIDPSRFLAALHRRGVDAEACLARLYLSRGFTLHQLDTQIARIANEITITRSPLVVVDGLLAMHQDDAIKPFESRILLRRHMAFLRQIAAQHHASVLVITADQGSNVLEQERIAHVARHAQNHLQGFWKGSERQRRLHLKHLRTHIEGMWGEMEDTGQLRWNIQASPVKDECLQLNTEALRLRYEAR